MHREIYVTRPAMPPFEEYCAEIRDLWDTCRLTNMGEKHRELEVKLKAYLHAPHRKTRGSFSLLPQDPEQRGGHCSAGTAAGHAVQLRLFPGTVSGSENARACV